MMFMTALAYVKSRNGYYPVSVIDFASRFFVVHTSVGGKEKISFKEITSLTITTKIPVTIEPK